jgi:nucleolar protein 9
MNLLEPKKKFGRRNSTPPTLKILTMPSEYKHKRGRRAEKKEKLEAKRSKRKADTTEDETPSFKRRKSHSQDPAEDEDVVFTGTDNALPLDEEEEGNHTERPFYGMLGDEEQEYFKRADELLELNNFPSEEERSLFLANVFREAEGKELKIACSQSCSRLMEKLILLSTVEQKKKLFEKFGGNYSHLIQHRFASHCCETLFIQSAPAVTEELIADSKKPGSEDEGVTMESLFLQTLDELEGQMTFLLTDRFASHTLRVLLVILSGRALEQSSTRTLIQSKKKEKISVTGLDTSPTELTLNKRSVPSSFQFAVEKIISDTIATMDQSFIRVLATHPTGNPTLQLLLELELSNPTSKKGSNAPEKTIISALLPDDIAGPNSESATFVNGILYDPIGSRLLETICTFAPGKLFKSLYRTIFKDRIGAIARNEISSYVAIRILNRISKEDLEEAVREITPQLLGLVQRSRTVIIKTLLERCHARGVDSTALVAGIAAAYDDKPETLVLKMAGIEDISTLIPPPPAPQSSEDTATVPPPQQLKPTPSQRHGSLLAQSMLTLPGPASSLIQASLLALQSPTLLTLSLYTTTSHIIQSALSPATPTNSIPFRRKLINTLLFPPTTYTTSPILQLALSPQGSHVLDALLASTTASTPTSPSCPLFSLAERIATTLTAHEIELRDSYPGRIVWRNWSLDLFKRARGDWVKKVKVAGVVPDPVSSPATAEKDGNVGEGDGEGKKKKGGKDKKKWEGKSTKIEEARTGKSAIQLARENFAAQDALKKELKNIKGTGANSGGVRLRK